MKSFSIVYVWMCVFVVSIFKKFFTEKIHSASCHNKILMKIKLVSAKQIQFNIGCDLLVSVFHFVNTSNL